MAYNDLSESKMTISTPYGPCRGADVYKNDTLSRSRNPENDTLFSGTPPTEKYISAPPRGTRAEDFWQGYETFFHHCVGRRNTKSHFCGVLNYLA